MYVYIYIYIYIYSGCICVSYMCLVGRKSYPDVVREHLEHAVPEKTIEINLDVFSPHPVQMGARNESWLESRSVIGAPSLGRGEGPSRDY